MNEIVQFDEEESKIIEKMIKEMMGESSKKTSQKTKFPLQGVYEFKEGRWLLISKDEKWKPEKDGFYVIFADDFSNSYLAKAYGEAYFKIAENQYETMRPIVKIFENAEAPLLTFICIANEEEYFVKSFEAVPNITDLATIIAYFALKCPTLNKKDLIKLQEICPCVSL